MLNLRKHRSTDTDCVLRSTGKRIDETVFGILSRLTQKKKVLNSLVLPETCKRNIKQQLNHRKTKLNNVK